MCTLRGNIGAAIRLLPRAWHQRPQPPHLAERGVGVSVDAAVSGLMRMRLEVEIAMDANDASSEIDFGDVLQAGSFE